LLLFFFFFFFQAEDGIRDFHVTGVQTCALPIWGVWNFPALGSGTVDFARVLEILRRADYTGPYSVELEFQGEPWPSLAEVTAAMRRSYAHLRSLGLS